MRGRETQGPLFVMAKKINSSDQHLNIGGSMALNKALTNNLAEFNLNDLDLESLEISDFLDEKKLSSAEEVANVMAASCTTCECCCSVSTIAVAPGDS